MVAILTAATMITTLFMGCAQTENGATTQNDAENVIITETGEIIEQPSTVQTEETPDAAEATPEVVTVSPESLVEPEQEQVIGEEDQTAPTGNEMQLVFLGDSLFDNSRDGTGIPYLTSVACEADVYNLAIGGTSATLEQGESESFDSWTSRSLVGVVNAILGNISTDIFEGTRCKEILDNQDIDFSQTDYFIIEYGVNDFFRGVSQSNPDKNFDIYTYTGALRYAISNLRSLAPDATIVLCGPCYAQFFNGTQFIGDGNSLNNGMGTLFDYKGTCQYISNEQQTLFLDAYMDLGIDSYTAEEYLLDGVHLTEAGRALYADKLSRIILGNEETKNN